MKRFLLVGMVIVFLAACSAEDASPGEAAANPTPAAGDAGPVGVPVAATAEEASLQGMIPGLQLGANIEVRGSRVYASPTGEQRRGFDLAYRDGSAEAVMQQLASAFGAAGYTSRAKATAGAVGEVRQNFSREGRPPAFVAVYPRPSGGAATPAAPGRIWISWTLAEGGAPIAAGSNPPVARE